MTMPIMPVPVDAPKATPPKSGLIAAIRAIGRIHEDEDVHIGLGGVSYKPEAAGPGGFATSPRSGIDGTDAYIATGADNKIADPGAIGVEADSLVNGYGFVVTVEESCSAFGWTEADYEGRVKRRMEALQSKIIAREFWSGETALADGLDPAVWQWLAQNTAVDITPAGGAADPRHALGLIEEVLGDTGIGTGFIHMSRKAAIMMPDRWGDGPLITWPDSVVAIDAGYLGTGPDGADPAAGESWIYATDVCDLWLDAVQVYPGTLAEALDKRKNTITYRAQRTAAVTWDGNTHVALRVTI